jgi:mono/diheme cytochrome c family protein
MRKLAVVSLALLAVNAMLLVWTMADDQPPPLYPPGRAQALATPPESAARGEQLAFLGGCHDCHTPKLPDGRLDLSRVLSGHPADAPLPPEVEDAASTNLHLTAWRGPWGLTLARNLTPDRETGIGNWSLEDFVKAMRTGVSPDGRNLYPPMPIPNYQNLPDEDLRAIYSYLRTLKPTRNPVGAPPAE